MKHLLFVVVGLASVTSAYAGISAKSRFAIESRAVDYFLLVADGVAKGSLVGEECKPSPQACMVYVAGPYATTSERTEAARACVGNYGDECAKYAAGPYSTTTERIAGAKACKNNRTIDCAKYVAGDDQACGDGQKVCADADLECVKYVAGPYATTAEKIAAAKSCGAQE